MQWASLRSDDFCALMKIDDDSFVQFDNLLPTLTVRETLLYAAELKRPNVKERSQAALAAEQRVKDVDALLDTLQLRSCEHTVVGSTLERGISGGQAKRVNIGISLVTKPRILFLDEPSLGLDVMSQAKIREFVKYYNEQYQATFIITSHYMNDIDSMCKRVYVMNKGRGLYDGDFSDLIKKINPTKKLVYNLDKALSNKDIEILEKKYIIDINDNILVAHLDDNKLNQLLIDLFEISHSTSFQIEDLPVEETMRSFFEDPENYLK